jgi:hypothetical protein
VTDERLETVEDDALRFLLELKPSETDLLDLLDSRLSLATPLRARFEGIDFGMS